MPVHLTHVAEDLFAQIVNCHRSGFAALAGIEYIVDPGYFYTEPIVAHAEVELEPYVGKQFDGASRIDCLVRVRPELGVAFELKLGHTRLSRKRVQEEWLKKCQTSHGETRWSGNMMAVLDRRFPVNESQLRANLNGSISVEVHPVWTVVARRKVVRIWESSPRVFSERTRCLAFEDVARLAGDPARFNVLVKELLPSDFYREWVGDA